MLVYKIWIQYTNLFKSYGTETIFQSWKRAITPKMIDGFYSKSNLTYILWLYTCVQNFNPINQSFQKISHGNHFSKLRKFFKVEKGHNSQNNWWISLNRTWSTFYDYIPVYKISIQYTNPFKRYRTEAKSVTYGTDGTGWMGRTGRTYVRTAVILYAPPPPPPIENGGGIKMNRVFCLNSHTL